MSVDNRLMEKVIKHQQECAMMSVWKKRLPEDNGWEFAAADRCPGTGWHRASPAEVQMIACHALSGNF